MLKTEYIAGALATLVFVVGLALVLDYALSLPTVNESYKDRVCVSVENYPGIVFNQEVYSCENMPEKFYHNWVE